jgi:anti-sigma B factor antagonist
MAFDCTIERQDDRMIVVPEGDIDLTSTPAMRKILQQVVALGNCRQIDVDMGAVTFLDSSGLGMLVAARRAAMAAGVALRLREPGPVVRMVLEVTNLEEMLTGEVIDNLPSG